MTDRGVTSVQFLLASALALVLFLAFANLVVVQYGRGALRSALEQGARAGAASDSAAECEAVAADVVGQLLGGRMSDGLTVRCAVSGGVMVATGSATFGSWTLLTPDFDIALSARAVIEP
ncbi:MAG: hypothetical protein ACE5F5_01480 [Acidimicrobiia bacterium]